MNYKLIALDVDGTLLNDDHVLTQATADTIKKAAAQGTEIVLCTGRAPLSCLPFMESMGLEGYVITHNGAATVEVATRRIVHEYAMQPASLEPYMEYCRKQGVHFDINTTYGIYIDNLKSVGSDVLEMYRKFLIEPLDLPAWTEFTEPIVKMTASGTAEVMDKVQADWDLWTHEVNMLRSGDYFIDLMHQSSSKGNALKQLAAKRGIPSEQVMAVGNFYNDITMLTFAGLGIAMDNSPVEVKAAAQDVTSSNNEEGVRLALEKYAL